MDKVVILMLVGFLAIGCGVGQIPTAGKKNVIDTSIIPGGIHPELLSTTCTRGEGEIFSFRLQSTSRTGGRLSGQLVPSAFSGGGGQGFGGCHPNGHLLYIEDLGNNEYGVMVRLCGFEGRDPRNWGSFAAVLSTKLNRFSELYDVTSSGLSFTRNGIDYYGRSRGVVERKQFSAVSCRRHR